jgi:hypothetical protein
MHQQLHKNNSHFMEDYKKKYLENLLAEEKQQLTENSEIILDFKKSMLTKGIELKDENFKYLQTIGIVAEYPNILGCLEPELINDKEGLLDFTLVDKKFENKRFANGYLYANNYMAMAHQYFRRGFYHANNFAPRFIELYWGFQDSEIDKYIALDFDRVRINVDDSMYMEFDTWYGAQFDKDISKIGDGIGKLRPPLDIEDFLVSFFFKNAYSLDTKWATKDGIKTFQAEEFKTDEIKILKDGVEYFPVRYIHAEYDLNKGHFRHFDGAIHFYTTEEYYSRRDSDFNYNDKSNNYIKTLSQKLFKINGKVSVETWIKFTSHFFSGNPLILEYFEGQYPKHIQEMLEKVRAGSDAK